MSVAKMSRKPIHPGEILNADYIIPSKLSQKRWAEMLKTTERTINEIVKGKRGISESIALRLSKLLGTSAEMWIRMQEQYNLWHIMQKEKSILDEIKRLEVA